MARKRLISSIMLCALLILFGHNVIPHHHHDDPDTRQSKGHHGHDHEDDDNLLEHAYSHFLHNNANEPVYNVNSRQVKATHFGIEKAIVHLTRCFIEQDYRPPILYAPSTIQYYLPPGYSTSSQLRGPPLA